MKALVKQAKGPGEMALLDVAEPRTGPGQVKVKIAHAGICGTDVHIASGAFFHYFPPLVLGHEFSGEVVETGAGVEGVPLGARVTAEPTKSTCRVCPHCISGRYNRCEERDIAGVVSNGAFTDYVVTRAESIHRLPDSVSLKAAALSEPLAVCVHGVCEQCSVRAGDVVLVMGPGAIGLGCAQVAIAHGARVMVAGAAKDAHRLALARSLGAEWTVNVEEESVLERAFAVTKGWGVDLGGRGGGCCRRARGLRRVGEKGRRDPPGGPARYAGSRRYGPARVQGDSPGRHLRAEALRLAPGARVAGVGQSRRRGDGVRHAFAR